MSKMSFLAVGLRLVCWHLLPLTDGTEGCDTRKRIFLRQFCIGSPRNNFSAENKACNDWFCQEKFANNYFNSLCFM